MGAIPAITIVVPAYQAESSIEACIRSLLALDYPESLREIVVVDNNSTDATAAIAARFPVKVLHESRRGAAAARNTGWQAASNDLVAFTDSDCVVDPGWLRALSPHFADPKIAGCGGRLVPAAPGSVVERYIIQKDLLSQERAFQRVVTSWPFFITANVIYRKAALQEAGGFDESFTGATGEDADLAWRIAWNYHELVYEPSGVVTHHHRSTLRGFLRQVRGYGSGASQLFHKHRRRLGFSRYWDRRPYEELAGGLARAPFALLRRDPLQRAAPALDAVSAAFFLWGKWRMSWKCRVWFI